MARQKKTVTTTRDATAEITCDLCRKKAGDPDGQYWNDTDDLLEVETRIEMIRTDVVNEQTEIVRFDICPDCFHNKLIPFFADKGSTLPTVIQV